MRNFHKVVVLFFILLSINSIAQKELKTGFVKYKMTSDSPEMAMMGETVMTIYFNDETQAIDMEMMGGMMTMKVVSEIKNPENTKLAMNTMGQKYEITDAGKDETTTKSINISNLENAESIVYDKKDVKQISGYSCYKADILYNDGKKAVFYITDKIKPNSLTNTKSKVQLQGYPLEMNIKQDEDTEIKVVATEISENLPSNWNVIPTDYQKLTMAEFQEKFKQE
jgi:hypothetical protein